jgi:ribosome-binding factor A
MPRFPSHRPGEPSQRQLRVGELVRHALADLFMRGEAGTEFDGAMLAIAEVRVSGDLKHATVLISPLASHEPEGVVDRLNRHARQVRHRIAPALRQMKYMPDLRFRLDTRFEDDRRIAQLLRSPKVTRDLDRREDE